MKPDTYFQRFKDNVFYGMKIGVVPTLLVNLLFGLNLSMGLKAAMWDFTIMMAIVASLLIITPYIIITFLGIFVISAIVAANKKTSNILIFLMGFLVATVSVAIADYIFVLLMNFEFLLLPSIVAVVLVAYLGQRINRHANLDSSLELELRGGLWMVLVAFIGSLAYVLIHYKAQLASLDTYIYLGKVFSISLPFSIMVGYLMGLVIKKIQKPA